MSETTALRHGDVIPPDEDTEPELSYVFAPRYVNVRELFDQGLTDAPVPEYCTRDDGAKLIYPAQLNVLYGDPESGKTWIALAAAVETLNDGKRILIMDLDHNGPSATISRLVAMGADLGQLVDPKCFRYIEPEDHIEAGQVVYDMRTWKPHLVVIDSIGELLPMFGANSNSADDFTRTHSAIIKPLVRAGAAVVAVDHMAKGNASRTQGAGGTIAKKRAIGGAYLRVVVDEPFTRGKGGSAVMTITKDRHSGVREYAKQARPEPIAAVFELVQDGENLRTTFRTPGDNDRAPSHSVTDAGPRVAEDADKVVAARKQGDQLDTKNEVRIKFGWGSQRALDALREVREREQDTEQ